ncbi:uncharacterized protein LOC121378839 isoform X2 [Gigantopelta aegis]|uniref:uncharacterized protein LOC121378839 isoform X2 n=1 Tax=Gigantopelta aegis TaxID=1735272 RepID=UPI001B88AE54|nr:uncharacterized protein LOC121378839 isoform X2 [Gigantopelta aegis]
MSTRPHCDSHQRLLKNHSVTSKCLAIVLQENSKSDNGNNLGPGNTDASPTSAGKVHNGKDLFDDFKLRNKTCYWNPSLIESIKNLGYLGFVEPSTILVGGNDIHLENLRSAWGRRVLKAPAGFTVERIGDVNGIEMQVIPQTQFIPLPDALCLIIMDLNNQRVVATLDTIFEKLQAWYCGMTMPNNQLIFNTLSHLVQERKIFHTGSGYFIVTPDTYRLPSDDPNMSCNASWLPYHPMYIPVFPQMQSMQQLQQLRQMQQLQQLRAPMRSISCQANMYEKLTSQVAAPECQPALPLSKVRPRSSSARGTRNKEKEKVAVDIENDDSNLKRTMSVKYKTDKATAITKDVNLKSSNINQTKQKGEKVSLFSKLFKKNKKKNVAPPPAPVKEAEYATFSGQFPPPEWQWYKQQVEKQRRTEEWVSQQGLGPTPDKSEPQRNVRPKSWFYLQNMVPDSNNHDQGTGGILEDRENTSFEKKCVTRRHRLKKEKTTLNIHDNMQESGVVEHHEAHPGMESLSPISANEDIYQSVGSSSKDAGPSHSTPRFYDTIPPRRSQNSECENQYVKLNNKDVEVVSRHHHNQHHHRRSHRSRRKSHRNSCTYDSHYNNDISYEYNGQLPNKHSVYAASKDSGVNCIGQSVSVRTSSSSHQTSAIFHRKENVVRNRLDELAEEENDGVGEFSSPAGELLSDEVPGVYAPQNSIDPNYYDSSINESCVGGVQIVCEAEINHQPIPEIVLDSEIQLGCYGPDVAQSNSGSNAGSRDALSSEKSFDTVIAGKNRPEDEDNKDSPSHLETINSNIRDLSFVDSGFSSPRNQEQGISESGKVNVQQQHQQQEPDNFENRSQNSKQNNSVPHAKEVCHMEQKHRPVPHLYPHVMNNQRPSRSNRCETQHYAQVDDLVQLVCPQTPEQLQLFKQQQLNSKRFGLNGEFEVVGVV